MGGGAAREGGAGGAGEQTVHALARGLEGEAGGEVRGVAELPEVGGGGGAAEVRPFLGLAEDAAAGEDVEVALVAGVARVRGEVPGERALGAVAGSREGAGEGRVVVRPRALVALDALRVERVKDAGEPGADRRRAEEVAVVRVGARVKSSIRAFAVYGSRHQTTAWCRIF